MSNIVLPKTLSGFRERFKFLEDGLHYVYALISPANDKMYIGSAANLYLRTRRHIRTLNNNTHPNKHLKSAWDIYDFELKILHVSYNIENILDHEQYYLDKYKSYDREVGYNSSKSAHYNTGIMGVPQTLETIAKIASKQRGKSVSEATRLKLSKAFTGRKQVNPRSGFKLSEETKRKIGLAHKGRCHPNNPFRPENRHRFTIPPMTEKTRRKIMYSRKDRVQVELIDTKTGEVFILPSKREASRFITLRDGVKTRMDKRVFGKGWYKHYKVRVI